MERGVWGERGRRKPWEASRIWLTWHPCVAYFCRFSTFFLTWFLGAHFCDFCMPSGRKSGSRASNLDNKS